MLRADDTLQIARLPLLSDDYDRVPVERRWGGGGGEDLGAAENGTELRSLEVSLDEARVLGKATSSIAKG